MIEIEFYGAAETVTGSNYLVKTSKIHFLVDCGMFQGPDVENRNLQPYEYDAEKVDFVLLTHAHIDHCGMLPKVYNEGFRGPIFATRHTIQIATLLLLDSAKIQESNFTKGEFYGKYTNQIALVYNRHDTEDTINLFRTVNFDEKFSPADGITVKYINAGHILGAASIEITIEDEGETKKILFSGDIGRRHDPLIETFDMNYRSEPDYVLIESLYGGQIHPDVNEASEELCNIIASTIDRGGNVYIPSFAVQRTQEMLNVIKRAKETNKLSEGLNVWLDSPLAQEVTKIYIASLQKDERDLFDFPNLKYVKKYKQSQALHKENGQVIVAGSGMADGGRIVDHLVTGLTKAKNTVAFVGFQAEGTLGRELVEGAKKVTIGRTKVDVKAKIVFLKGFSAHGDTNDYKEWIKRHVSSNLKKVFLIHAEPEKALAMQNELSNMGISQTYIPKWKETAKLV